MANYCRAGIKSLRGTVTNLVLQTSEKDVQGLSKPSSQILIFFPFATFLWTIFARIPKAKRKILLNKKHPFLKRSSKYE
jgi:hypothetical protein